MKLKNIDNINKGDILIINKLTGLKGKFELGERFIFERFNRLDIMSSSTIYLIKESNNELMAFTVGISKNLETLQSVRDMKINHLTS